MRQVGDVQGRRRADRFLDFLASHGIEADLREDGDERFGIWVFDEDQMTSADEHYRAFKVAPDAAVFDAPARKQKKPLTPKPLVPGGGRGRYIDVRTEIFGRGRLGAMPVTVAYIAISVLLTLLMNVPGLTPRFLYSLPEIMNGQVWRIVTPIFLHGGVLHLLFNMLWLYQLGGAIEIHEGSVYFAVTTLVIGAVVNTAQYFVSGPYFLGMSGVVYALFGYVWMMSRYQAATRYVLARETVIVMLVWLVICLVGIIPGAANTEHIAGLVVGVAWGFLRSGHLGTVMRRRKYRG